MEKYLGLEYEVHGEGEPVLLIHGSHVADALAPLARENALAERYRLIRYRRRGFAGCDRHTGPFSVEDQARDAAALLEHLGVERTHVIGHSYGAVTAIQLALDAPDVVGSLVLLEPPLGTAEGAAAAEEAFAPIMEAYGSGDAVGAVDMFMQYVGGSDWRTAVEKTVPGGPEQAEADAASFFEVELPALGEWFGAVRLDRLACPSVYVLGAESVSDFETAKDLFLSEVPGGEEVVLPGLDHLLQMRDPALVARTAADFLARHAV